MGRRDKRSIKEKLEEYSKLIEGGHRRWLGAHTIGGYGSIWAYGKVRLAHIVAFCEYHNRELGTTDNILHKPPCPYKDCIAEDHLYEGTCSDNMKDLVQAGNHNNASKTECPHGHKYTPENTRISNGGRFCLQCEKIKAKERVEKRLALVEKLREEAKLLRLKEEQERESQNINI